MIPHERKELPISVCERLVLEHELKRFLREDARTLTDDRPTTPRRKISVLGRAELDENSLEQLVEHIPGGNLIDPTEQDQFILKDTMSIRKEMETYGIYLSHITEFSPKLREEITEKYTR